MRSVSPLIGILVPSVALLAGGCGDGDTVCDGAAALSSRDAMTDVANDHASASDGQAGSTPGVPVSDAGVADATMQVVTEVRLANWSPDSPAVDVCLAPHGTKAFAGPIVQGLAASMDDDGSAGGLQFLQVTAYAPMAPGLYDARLVVGGATDCSAGIGADYTMLPSFGPNQLTTLALVGEAHPPAGAPPTVALSLNAYPDYSLSPAGVELRFINADPDAPSISFGTVDSTGTGFDFYQIFSSVPFGQAGQNFLADPDAGDPANGYFPESQVSATNFAAVPPDNYHSLFGVAPSVDIAGGTVATFVMTRAAADAATAAQFLECFDNAGTIGVEGSCTLLPTN
jgi:hypothetical protein